MFTIANRSNRTSNLISLIAVLATMTFVCNVANATSVTLTGSYVDGTAYSNYFDISSLLPAGNEVTSARVTARFRDDGESSFSQTVGPYVETYTETADYPYLVHYFYRDVTNNNFNAYEAAQLDIGSDSFNSSSNYYSSTTYVNYYFDGSNTSGYDEYDYYHKLYIRDYGYNGDFTIDQMLSMATIDSLNQNAGLAFAVSATSGDFYLLDITLTFESAVKAVPAATPLPPTPFSSLPPTIRTAG